MSSLLRSASSSASRASSSRSIRSLHVLPPFENLKVNAAVYGQHQGSKKASRAVFLPAPVVKRLTLEYHQGLLDRLNEQVRGTRLESLKIVPTIQATADEPDQALAFNYASSSLNNAFFLSGLRQAGSPTLDRDFMLCLIKSFGSLRRFEQAAAATINSMASTGWLWLVKRHHPDQDPGHARIELLVSYAAGTIVSPKRQQSGVNGGLPFLPDATALNANGTLKEVAKYAAGSKPTRGRDWSASRSERSDAQPRKEWSGAASQRPTGSFALLTPLACLSMHERSYLDHHGHGGRLAFFRQWLHALDYDKVHARLGASGPMIDFDASEDVQIERWHASADSITDEQAAAVNDALRRAHEADAEAVARGEPAVYDSLPRQLDMQYFDGAGDRHLECYDWSTSSTPEPEPESGVPASEGAPSGEAPVAAESQAAETATEAAPLTNPLAGSPSADATPSPASSEASSPVEDAAPAEAKKDGGEDGSRA